jgi:DNA-binding SARP family transcriptional activator/Tfp pilus assembly protein PilF/TolB-like protein
VVADGHVVTGAAAQPRRLAVLALLARAGRAGVTREKVLALLWPDEPEERARRSLNQAVYSLRRDLGGEDSLLGTKDLRINLDLIEVDAVEFQDALAAGDLDRAVQLYNGPFLDGFFVPRGQEFERWVETERAALARDFSAALERVAVRASQRGDTGAAVAHWRRLAAGDPLNARIAMAVMQALVAAGDVTGAISHARLHEVLLDQELGLPPDREIVSFARQLRERTQSPAGVVEPAAATAPTQPAAADGPAEPVSLQPVNATPATPAVLLGAFGGSLGATGRPRGRTWAIAGIAAVMAIAGATTIALTRERHSPSSEADARLVVAVGAINDYASADSTGVARALRDMLATNLARAAELTVISGSRLLEVERQMNDGAPSSPGAIGPVARQAGATTLVDGALYPLGGDTLRLDLRVTSLREGNVLRAYTVTGRDAFALADSATAKLVDYLGSAAPRGSVADETTRSVTAYRLYVEGRRSYYLGDVAAADRLFDAALAEDSTFAMAAYFSALSSRTSRTEFLRRLRRAVVLAARASERERLIIEGGWAEANNSPLLRAIAETLAVRYPAEVEGHYYLGRALVNGGEFLAAIAPLHRVEVMDSLSLRSADARCAACDALLQQTVSYMLADSMAAAERVVRRWIASRPRAWIAHVELGRILSGLGRFDEAAAEFRNAASLDRGGNHWEPMSTLLIRSGQFGRADEMLRAEVSKAVSESDPHWFLAISLRNQGRLADALGEARAYRRGNTGIEAPTPGAADPSSLQEAQVLREVGRYQESSVLFDSISRFRVDGAEASAVASGRAWALTHAAGALAAAGDSSRLGGLADAIERAGAGSNLARDQRLHHHVRGLLLVARGNDSAAVAEFRRAVFSTTLGYTRTNVEMARALIRLKRHPEAIAVLESALRGSLEAANLYVTHSEVRLVLAEAYARAGQRERAARELAWVARAWSNAEPLLRPRLAEIARLVGETRR